jgi:hypothetical protein
VLGINARQLAGIGGLARLRGSQTRRTIRMGISHTRMGISSFGSLPRGVHLPHVRALRSLGVAIVT